MKRITAVNLARAFAQMARQANMRVGYRGGVRNGFGQFPYDTGALQRKVYVSRGSKTRAQVRIGKKDVNYAEFLEFAEKLRGGQPNRHKGFVERLVTLYFPWVIRSQFGCEVSVCIVQKDEGEER